MKDFLRTICMLVSILALCTLCTMAALEDINEDTCTVVKEVVKKGTPVIDGKLDEIYTDSLTLKLHGPASSYYISGGSCEDTTATGTVYALHDDNYVYVFYHVVDNTLIKADPEYVEISAHPHLTDAVEVRIGDDLKGHFAPYDGSNDAHHLLYADAHGVRYSAFEDSFGDDTEKLKHKTKIDSDGKTYYVEMAIPLQKPFRNGEIIEFEFQIDDLQDDMDSMCAVGSGYPHNLVSFPVDCTVTTEITSESKIAVAGGKIEVPVILSGNPGLAGLGFSITYDDGLTLTKVERGDALSSMSMTVSNDISIQPVAVLFDAQDSDNTNGTLCVLTFEVDENAAVGEYDINISVTDAYDINTDDVDIEGIKTTVTVKDCLPGDINGDGVVELKDVTTLRRYLAGGYGVTVVDVALDVNGDGEVELKDVTILRRYLAGGYGVELK